MPDKHIKFAESLLGLGSYILDALTAPQTIDNLWDSYLKARKAGYYPAPHSFDNLVLAVDILFAIGAIIETDHNGVLQRCG